MATSLAVSRRRIAVVAAFALGLTASAAHGAIPQSSLSVPARATLTGANDSAATGQCLLLITFLRTKATVHCTIDGGAPLTSLQLRADRFDTPVHTELAPGPGPFSFTVAPLPAVVPRALAGGELRIEGHTAAGLEIDGRFAKARDAVIFGVPMHRGEVVPPSSSGSVAGCFVTVLGNPSFLGIDCVHDMADPQTFTLHTGPFFQVGDAAVDLGPALGDTNPVYWQPLDDFVRLEIAVDAAYLRLVGSGEGEIIRGQIDGCRTSDSSVCMFGLLNVRADGEPTDQSVPRIPASGELLATSFDSLVVNPDQVSTTQTALFSVSADNEQSLLVEVVNQCSTGQRYLLNVVATDFEAFHHFVFFRDLVFGLQDALTTAGGLRLERRQAVALPCPPQLSP